MAICLKHSFFLEPPACHEAITWCHSQFGNESTWETDPYTWYAVGNYSKGMSFFFSEEEQLSFFVLRWG